MASHLLPSGQNAQSDKFHCDASKAKNSGGNKNLSKIITMNNRSIIIYKVAFATPPYAVSDMNEFFYSSIAAIYEDFTPKQIGCGAARLYSIGVREGVPYQSKKCRITRHFCVSKRKSVR